MLPREKYLEKGIENLTDVDLLSIIIGRGIKGRNFLTVSKSVLSRMRSVLSCRRDLNINDIVVVEGIGVSTAMRILCGIELGNRLYGTNMKERCFVRNSTDAYKILKDIRKKKQEYVVGMFLNSRFEVLTRRTISIGSFDHVSILPRDIIIPALEVNASSVVLAHNHPSGDCTPSQEDISLTQRIVDGLNLVGLNLLDHLVIGGESWERIEV